MSPHVFALRRAPGVPSRLSIRGLPNFGHGYNAPRYRLIEDDDVADALRARSRQQTTPVFRTIEADDLEDALDTAADAANAIGAGEYDDVLDLLLFAERRVFGSRVTVIDAIGDRKRTLEEQLTSDEDDATDDTLKPGDVAPVRE